MLSWLVLASLAWSADWQKSAPFETDARELSRALDAMPAHERLPGVRLLLEEHVLAYDEQGRETQTFHRIYKVTDTASVEGWGFTEASWAPWHQERPTVRVRVIDARGKEYTLTDAEMNEETPSRGDPVMYSDARSLRAPLPGMAIGSIVEEQVVIREHRPFLGSGAAHRIPLAYFNPTALFRLRVEVPQSLPLFWEVREGEGRIRSERKKGLRILTWEAQDSEPPEGDWFLPDAKLGVPHLALSTSPGWRALGLAYQERIGELDTSGLDELVARMQEGSPSPSELVDRAYRIARDELRYTGLELGEQAIVPYAPKDSLARGYGDCKDKATLLIALLSHVGIEAHLAILRAGPETDISPDLPGANGFNHAIAYVPSQDRFLDPTASYTAPDQLPPEASGRWALVIKPEGGELLQTPPSRSSDHVYREVRAVALAPSGRATLEETMTTRGWPARSFRYDLADASETELDEWMTSYGAETYLADALASVSLSGTDDPEADLELTTAYTGVGIAGGGVTSASVWAGRQILQNRLPDALYSVPEDDWLAERTEDIVLTPFVSELVYQVEVPTLYVPRTLPSPEHREWGSWSWTVEVDAEASPVVVRYRLDAGDGRISAADARAVREVLAPLAEDEEWLWDQQGALLQEDGRLTEALALYAERRDQAEDGVMYGVWRCEALMDVRLTRLARACARELVKAHPDSPSSHNVLGYTLLHGEDGSQLANGYDQQGALAAYTRAWELGGEATTLHNLALLSERGESGQRLGPTADLDAAAKWIRTYEETTGERTLEVNLLRILLRQGHFDEVLARIDDEGIDTSRLGLRLTALALRDGMPALKEELREWTLDSEDRADVLTTATQALLNQRAYPLAAEVMRLGEATHPNPFRLHQLADDLAATRHWEDVLADADPVERVPMELMAALFGHDEERFLAQLSKVALERMAETGRGFDEEVQGLDATDMDGLTWQNLLDLGFREMTLTVDGKGKQRRVLLSTGGIESRYYLVQERGRFRLRCAEQVSELARAAIEAGRGKKVEEVRQWVTWIGDELGVSPGDNAAHWAEASLDEMLVNAALVLSPTDIDTAMAVFDTIHPAVLEENLAPVLRVEMLQMAGRTEQALALADEIVTPNLERDYAMAHVARLAQAGRSDTVAVARTFAEAVPDNRFLVPLAQALTGDHAASDAGFEALHQEGALDDTGLHLYARSLVHRDPPEYARAQALAMEALSKEEQPRQHLLLTAAWSALGAGDPDEAVRLHLAALRLFGDELDDSWRLVEGGLARAWGMEDVAQQAWAEVPESKDVFAPRELIP